MTDTVADLISQALKMSGVLGIGQVAASQDTSDALFQVNLILGQWNRKRWLNVDLTDVVFVATGAQSYTIGAGATINVPRPDRIEAAFARMLVFSNLTDGNGNPLVDGNGNNITDGGSYAGIDYPLAIISAREDYNPIWQKNYSTWPQAIFYDSAYPLGNVFIWPLPSSAYEIHLSLKCGIAQITDPLQPLLLPDEYSDALLWCLAARMRPMYQMPPDPTITAGMRAALNTIRNANAQVPQAQMPRAVLPRRFSYASNIAAFNSGYFS